MKKRIFLLAFVLAFTIFSTSTTIAQEKVEDYGMAEITFMRPKIGMEKAFVEAVTKHNDKYHKEGTFKARLELILTGKETGWYVWVMGPCTFTDLDNRPDDASHLEDWNKNVSPSVAKYGRTEYWKFSNGLSNASKATPKYETIWFLEIKEGEYHRFKDFMKKIKKVHEKHDDYYSIYNNQFGEDDGRDVAIIWPQNNWASFDEKSNIKKKYEEMYGSGSWDNALKDWRSFVVSLKSQVWELGVK